jgi:hypothetical protein
MSASPEGGGSCNRKKTERDDRIAAGQQTRHKNRLDQHQVHSKTDANKQLKLSY